MITTEQLQRLTDLINARFAEFETQAVPMFDQLSLGQVRLIIGTVDEWEAELDEAVIDDYANARKAAYDNGYEKGYRHGIEVGAFNGARAAGEDGPDALATARELVAMISVASSPAVSAAGTPNANGSTATHVDAPATLTEPAQTENNGGSADLVALAESPDLQADTMMQSPAVDDDDLDDIDEDFEDDPDDLDIGINGEPLPAKRKREDDHAYRARLARLKRQRAEKRAVGSHSRTAYLEPEAERKQKPKENHLPTLKEMVAELQRQSMGGVMPTMKQFDDAKPANWASAWAHIQRLNTTWTQLAEEAGLKPRKPGWDAANEQRLSKSAATVLGPDHVAVTPLRPRTLAEVDGERAWDEHEEQRKSGL